MSLPLLAIAAPDLAVVMVEPWDGVIVVESLVSATPLVVIIGVLTQWQSTVLVALLFAALALGIRVVSGMERLGKRENEPRLSSWFVFETYWLGLPLPGSPLVFLLPQILHRARTSRPHPSGKGRGGCRIPCFHDCWWHW